MKIGDVYYEKHTVTEISRRTNAVSETQVERVDTVPQKWIPVSERLPSDDKHVIVSVLDDHGDTPWKYTTVAWLCNGVWISDNDILCGTTVAWMPLPQPYEPQESEDEG